MPSSRKEAGRLRDEVIRCRDLLIADQRWDIGTGKLGFAVFAAFMARLAESTCRPGQLLTISQFGPLELRNYLERKTSIALFLLGLNRISAALAATRYAKSATTIRVHGTPPFLLVGLTRAWSI